MAKPALTFARFVATPENRAAWLAVHEVSGRLLGTPSTATFATLLLHGPPGQGKSHLVQALAAHVIRQRADAIVTTLTASELGQPEQGNFWLGDDDAPSEDACPSLQEARHCDLLIVEDLQNMNRRGADILARTMDYLEARRRPMVFTANAGPQRLAHRGQQLPAILTNRLAAGLVVALEPLGPASRLALLQTLAQRRQLAISTEVLRWLADHLSSGGRQLEGAIVRLEMLAKLSDAPVDLSSVEKEFREQLQASQLTAERIAEHVSSYFQVQVSDLQSAKRYRNVVLSRQVGMYLVRQLTPLSLDQIGEYFGGRDHSTVLHACRKVRHALPRDKVLAGAIRELQAALT